MRLPVVGALVAAAVCGADPGFAADIPAKAPVYKAPVAVEQAPTWTGFYIGAVGGYARGPVHADPAGILPAIGAYSVDFTADGGFAGGQVGYDYQLPNGVVLGAVGDMSWAHIRGSACAEVTAGRCSDADPRNSYANGTVNWLSTVRGKAGFAFTPSAMVYATGGLALAGTRAEDTFIDGTHNVTADGTHVGWTAGAGAQVKVSRQFSLGLEYLYADLGKQDYTFSSANLGSGLAGQPIGISADLKLNILKGALNFHF